MKQLLTPFLIVVLMIATMAGLAQKSLRPVDLVYPQLDTENSRWIFFSSACRPFGMVNLFPDTRTNGDWGSGYRYEVDTLKGFSHIHEWQLSGLSVMPVVVTEANRSTVVNDHASKFSHAKERVHPGYHEVFLDRYAIRAELTATSRVGFHRYHFPEKSSAGVVLNINGELGPCVIKEGRLRKTGPSTIEGSLVDGVTRRRPKECVVCFHIEFDQPILSVERDEKSGNYLVTTALPPARELLMKVALSYTTEQNAAFNLQKELPSWDFDGVVREASDEWNQMLSRIAVRGGTVQQQQRFYTDLYHSLLGRRTISDANGDYPDNTGNHTVVRQIPLDPTGRPLFNQYNFDAFWGAQWTLNTLWCLVYPEIAEEFVRSMMQYYRDGGLIPRGPAGGNYTFVMVGASTTPFVVSAFQKGILRDQPEEIYQALKKNHLPGGIMSHAGYEHKTAMGGGLTHYIEKGYVPFPLPDGDFGFHQDGAGMTLEYAYQDWTLAQMALALGHHEDYEQFLHRSANYRNLFDPETGWIRPRDVNGKWLTPFDPYALNHGFIEANSAQSTWFVPHDLPGLARLMGGTDAALAKLEQSFAAAQKLGFTSGNSHSKEEHPEYSRIPINYGNEPSIQTAFVFHLLGHPDRTQYWSREVVNAAFSGLSPATGYNGDEDQGLMGTLAVLYKIGLFQMNGGTEANPEYQIGSPIFDEVILQLHPNYYSGKTFTIRANHNNDHNRFVGAAYLNGKSLNRQSLTHQEITKGGELRLEMVGKAEK
ncbi:MAG: GH92 family glycosyl hydrolase [Marinilabiliales bacterium]|nr:GH92 family glycosyl hydrolase [Marinilabiliales bacterium]